MIERAVAVERLEDRGKERERYVEQDGGARKYEGIADGLPQDFGDRAAAA